MAENDTMHTDGSDDDVVEAEAGIADDEVIEPEIVTEAELAAEGGPRQESLADQARAPIIDVEFTEVPDSVEQERPAAPAGPRIVVDLPYQDQDQASRDFEALLVQVASSRHSDRDTTKRRARNESHSVGQGQWQPDDVVIEPAASGRSTPVSPEGDEIKARRESAMEDIEFLSNRDGQNPDEDATVIPGIQEAELLDADGNPVLGQPGSAEQHSAGQTPAGDTRVPGGPDASVAGNEVPTTDPTTDAPEPVSPDDLDDQEPERRKPWELNPGDPQAQPQASSFGRALATAGRVAAAPVQVAVQGVNVATTALGDDPLGIAQAFQQGPTQGPYPNQGVQSEFLGPSNRRMAA